MFLNEKNNVFLIFLMFCKISINVLFTRLLYDRQSISIEYMEGHKKMIPSIFLFLMK